MSAPKKNRRWSAEQVREIRRRFRVGATYAQLRADFGGSLAALANLRQRRTYREV